MLLRSLPNDVKTYVVLHASSEGYTDYRTAALKYEQQQRLFQKIFFRPSPSWLSPGRSTGSSLYKRIVQKHAKPPHWEYQKRAWTLTQSSICQRLFQKIGAHGSSTLFRRPFSFFLTFSDLHLAWGLRYQSWLLSAMVWQAKAYLLSMTCTCMHTQCGIFGSGVPRHWTSSPPSKWYCKLVKRWWYLFYHYGTIWIKSVMKSAWSCDQLPRQRQDMEEHSVVQFSLRIPQPWIRSSAKGWTLVLLSCA